MDTHAAREITAYLEPVERLLWAGVPKQGLVLRAADAFLLPFSVLWAGFAVFWEVGVLSAGAPVYFALFGVPFVLIGIYIVIGRFFVDARRRSRTFYGLTDRRVVIVSGILARNVSTSPLRTLNDISVQERADRSGTVTFGRPHPWAWGFAGASWPGTSQLQAPSFELIPGARSVHDQVLAAQRAAS